jgi:hypothetical protein
MRRVTGAAALSYVVLAAIENMELLGAPALGAPAAEVRAVYDDTALSVITTTAGALLLAGCAAFAALLAKRWLPAAMAGGARGHVPAPRGVRLRSPAGLGLGGAVRRLRRHHDVAGGHGAVGAAGRTGARRLGPRGRSAPRRVRCAARSYSARPAGARSRSASISIASMTAPPS